MELQYATVSVTGATGNLAPYVTDSLVDGGADVVGTGVTDAARDDDADQTIQPMAEQPGTEV